MEVKIEITGHVDDKGALIIPESVKRRFRGDLRALSGKTVQVVIKEKNRRSSLQNRYYWGIVVEEIRLELLRRGNRFDADTVHEFLKQRFNSEKIEIGATGELLEVGQTTTTMNKEEFSLYVERVIEWAAMTLEITISPPGEQTELFAA